MRVKYFHPVVDSDGKRLSTANIIWAERDKGNCYYSYSKYAMNGGKFPANHPCSPGGGSGLGAQMGDSLPLRQFRERGYWASCFPEGDGITLKWWQDVPEPNSEKTAEQVMQDIRECFGWEVTAGR